MRNRNLLILYRAAQITGGLGVVTGLVMGTINIVQAIGYALDLDFEVAVQHVLISFFYTSISCLSWYVFKVAGQSE